MRGRKKATMFVFPPLHPSSGLVALAFQNYLPGGCYELTPLDGLKQNYQPPLQNVDYNYYLDSINIYFPFVFY